MKKIIFITISVFFFLGLLSWFLGYLNSGFITVKVSPKDANIILDQKKEVIASKKIRAKKGRHNLTITKDGHLSENVSFELKKKEKKALAIILIKNISEFLPENNDHFQVELIDNEYYEVTLYPILNRPDQLESYEEDLKEFKKEALKWLKEKGVDTKNKDKIKFIPEESEKQ